MLLTPILLPIVVQVGVDPIHFGIIMILNLDIGLCTPPVGTSLLVGAGIGRISLEKNGSEPAALLCGYGYRAVAGYLHSGFFLDAARAVALSSLRKSLVVGPIEQGRRSNKWLYTNGGRFQLQVATAQLMSDWGAPQILVNRVSIDWTTRHLHIL